MPRDSSGNYSLPNSYLAVTGQFITALQHNAPLEDIRDGLTASLPRSGVAAMTGPLNMAGHNIGNAGTVSGVSGSFSGNSAFGANLEVGPGPFGSTDERLAVAFEGGVLQHGLSLRSKVNDASTFIHFETGGGTTCGSVSSSGTSVSYNTTSDVRLKFDFQPFQPGSLFDAIAIYDFGWVGSEKRGIGVVAQELYPLEPRAVSVGHTMLTPATEDRPARAFEVPWTVDYSKLVPHLIAEVKALRRRVAALEGPGAISGPVAV